MTSSTNGEISKTQQFKRLLQSKHLEFLMEAHNALSARIVEETGFSGIWASGLSISAALGVRDNNEASWTQVLEVVEFMSDATRIPILLDGDTGYGNFNNMRRLVKKLEQRGVAAVCIEDKLFPKTNSFITSERQSLATIDEFTGKIKAVKDAQRDPVKEARRLQNAEDLLLAEERYLPKRRASTRAIILAPSRGDELGEVTAGIPKAMVPVSGTPLLHKLVAQFGAAGVRAITVVRGYAAEKVHAPNVEFVENEDFEGTGELLSLHQARDRIDGDAIISFGDILFRQHILNNLLADKHDIVIAVDAMWEQRREREANGYVDYITETRPYSLSYDEEDAFLAKMGPDLSADKIHGEWIGLIKTTARGSAAVCGALDVLSKRSDFRGLHFDDLFNYLVCRGQRVQVLYVTGQWLDVDDLEDLARAQAF